MSENVCRRLSIGHDLVHCLLDQTNLLYKLCNLIEAWLQANHVMPSRQLKVPNREELIPVLVISGWGHVNVVSRT